MLIWHAQIRKFPDSENRNLQIAQTAVKHMQTDMDNFRKIPNLYHAEMVMGFLGS